MDIYLPIAGLSVNALVIVGLGGLVGLLTGMVGVGGGFLTTPILIFYGIPPSVAVASAATGASWIMQPSPFVTSPAPRHPSIRCAASSPAFVRNTSTSPGK